MNHNYSREEISSRVKKILSDVNSENNLINFILLIQEKSAIENVKLRMSLISEVYNSGKKRVKNGRILQLVGSTSKNFGEKNLKD